MKEHLQRRKTESEAKDNQVRLDKYLKPKTFKELEPSYQPTKEDIAKKKEFVKRGKRHETR